EQRARVRSAAFDKTGTLPQGSPTLVDARPAPGVTAEELLTLAASAEQYSSHVLAAGIRSAAADRGLVLRAASEAGEVATNGVTAVVDGRTVGVGKPAYVSSFAPETVRPTLSTGEAAAYVAVDGRVAGVQIGRAQGREG